MAKIALRVLAGSSFVLALVFVATAKDRGDPEWVGPIIAAATGVALLIAGSIATRKEHERWNEEQKTLIPQVAARLRTTSQAIGTYRKPRYSPTNDEQFDREKVLRCVRLFYKNPYAGPSYFDSHPTNLDKWNKRRIDSIAWSIAERNFESKKPIVLEAAVSVAERSVHYNGFGDDHRELPLTKPPAREVSDSIAVLQAAFPEWYETENARLARVGADSFLVLTRVYDLLLLAHQYLDEIVAAKKD